MNKKIEQAMGFHQKGFNCAQAVGMPFAEELGMPLELAAKALEGFGAGMGGREQACGALSGAIFVAGLKYADGNLEAPSSKKETYEIAKGLCESFEKHCGATACKAIKGEGITSCDECIRYGIALAYQMLNK